MIAATQEIPMPRYEGYLFLQEGGRQCKSPFPDASSYTDWSTKAGGSSSSSNLYRAAEEGWVERWCSLEGGKLLVYSDRTAAIVRPEQLCSTIDMSLFRQIHTTASYGVSSQGPWELTLIGNTASSPTANGTATPIMPKSSTIANMALLDRSFRCQSSEISMNFQPSKSLSKTASPTIPEGQSSFLDRSEANPEKGNAWSKLTSRSRKLYKLVSGGSSAFLSEQYRQQSAAQRQDDKTPSIESLSGSNFSVSTLPSPATPRSALFSPVHDSNSSTVVLRASSAAALSKWAEALSYSIRGKPIAQSVLSSAVAPRRKARLSLSSIPGLRTVSAQGTAVFPANIVESSILMTEAAVQSRREESFSSLNNQEERQQTNGFTLPASDLFRRRQHRTLHLSADLSDITQASSAGDASRPSTASASNRRSSSRPSRSRPNSMADLLSHARTESASSVLTGSAMATRASSLRRASTSFILEARLDGQVGGGPLLEAERAKIVKAEEARDAHHAKTDSTGSAEQAPLDGRMTERAESSRGFTPIVADASASGNQTRHRRSGSFLSRGSMRRIVAWRDASLSTIATINSPTKGLGLEFQYDAQGRLETDKISSISKEKKGLAKLRSLGIRPSSRAGKRESLQALRETNWAVLERASPVIGGANSVDASPVLQFDSIKASSHRGLPRATSLLSLSKFGFGSTRERSPGKSSLPLPGDVEPHPSAWTALSPVLQTRIEPEGCDFSYEAVGGTPAAASTASRPGSRMSVLSSVPNGDSTDSGRESPFLALNGRVLRLGPGKMETTKRALTPSPREALKGLLSEPEQSPEASPPVVERILPPEHIIATFDRLRESEPCVKPAGNSLGLADMDRSVHPLPARKSSSRPSTSPQMDGSVPLAPFPSYSDGLRLNTSRTAFAQAPAERQTDYESLPSPLRSLPAPPRANKRIKDSKPMTLPRRSAYSRSASSDLISHLINDENAPTMPTYEMDKHLSHLTISPRRAVVVMGKRNLYN